jgi:hypothetical protein
MYGGHIGKYGGHMGKYGRHMGKGVGHMGKYGGHMGKYGGHMGKYGGHMGKYGKSGLPVEQKSKKCQKVHKNYLQNRARVAFICPPYFPICPKSALLPQVRHFFPYVRDIFLKYFFIFLQIQMSDANSHS